jgi:hypothetical protein
VWEDGVGDSGDFVEGGMRRDLMVALSSCWRLLVAKLNRVMVV